MTQNILQDQHPMYKQNSCYPVSKCLSNVWIYNYQQHFNEKHENEEFPKEMLIDAAEVTFHKTKK